MVSKTHYIKILLTEGGRREQILTDGETGEIAEFKSKEEGERWLVKNEADLQPGAFYTVTESFKRYIEPCKTCKGEGGYHEDVAGDGGSRMWIPCDDCHKEEEE